MNGLLFKSKRTICAFIFLFSGWSLIKRVPADTTIPQITFKNA